MIGRIQASLVALLVVAACSSSTSSSPAPAAPSADAGATSDASDAAASTGNRVAASDYCETIAGFFCDFYLRCKRMVAADAAECKTVFLETCNARYEPRYVELEQAGLLSLSRAGIDACEAHLGKVACDEQVTDLDGPCDAMWKGTAPAGAPCAIDVESFVCSAGTTCVLGLDFCGTCQVAAKRGEACEAGTVRCTSEDTCTSGTCVARALPGGSCSDTVPCVASATCASGTCVAPAIVGEGASCDASHRCAYRAYCSGGKCVRGALLGESCASPGACVSGRCVAGKCAPLLDDGAACGAPADCASAQCSSGKCTPLPSACLAH